MSLTNVDELERAVEQQLKDGSIDGRTLRGLLRAYALTGRLSPALVAGALAGALTLHPEPAFLACLYLLPESAASAPVVRALADADAALAAADWPAFWAAVAAPEPAAAAARVAGFKDAVRGYIFGAVNRTAARVEAAELAASLALPPADAVAFALARRAALDAPPPAGGAPDAGAWIVMPPLPENSDRKRSERADPVALRPDEVKSVLSLLTR